MADTYFNIQVFTNEIGFKEEQNAMIESMDDYLSNKQYWSWKNCSPIKLETDIELKLDLDDIYVYNNDANPAYVKITTSTSNRVFYYFVRKCIRLANNTLKLYCHIDVLNTYGETIKDQFSNKTHVIRDMRDRYVQPTGHKRPDVEGEYRTTSYWKKIDRYNEGINPTQINVDDQEYSYQNNIPSDLSDVKWYLVYKNHLKDALSAVDMFIVPDKEDLLLSNNLAGINRVWTSENNLEWIKQLNSLFNVNVKKDVATNAYSSYLYYPGGYPTAGIIITDKYSTVKGLTSDVEWKTWQVTFYLNEDHTKTYTIKEGDVINNHTVRGVYILPRYRNDDGTVVDYEAMYLYGDDNPTTGLPANSQFIPKIKDNTLLPDAKNKGMAHSFTLDRCTYGGILAPDKYYWNQTDYEIRQRGLVVFNSYLIGPSLSINDINKADTYLTKIIALPYCPFNIEQRALSLGPNYYLFSLDETKYPDLTGLRIGFSSLDGMVKIINPSETISCDLFTTFFNNLSVSIPNNETDGSLVLRVNHRYEDPKILNSEFTTVKYNFDSFNMPIRLEDLDFQSTVDSNSTYGDIGTFGMDINYIQASNMSSQFMFTPKPIYTNNSYSKDYKSLSYKTINDYDVLVVNRNNEVPLYNSAYVDYLNSGYNYDKKTSALSTQQQQLQIQQELNSGLANSVVNAATGAIKGGAVGALIGAATSLLSTGLNNINSKQSLELDIKQRENSIQRSLATAAIQSATVNIADNITLLEKYNNNKLHLITYEPYKEIKEQLDDLFYYYGYATTEYRVPNLNNRQVFNYIQCTPYWKSSNIFIFDDFMQLVNEKCINGFTIYHKVKLNNNDYWDLNQQYENWETSIINL